MSVKKAKEGIRYSFYCPDMTKHIIRFVQTHKDFQFWKKKKVGDMSSIPPVAHTELPFEVMNNDIIGPVR